MEIRNAILFNLPLWIAAIMCICCLNVVNIASGSMESTIMTNDTIVALRKNVAGEIERGDVILFRHPEYDYVLCKRVIGLPGETIQIKAGQIYVNGELLQEDYLSEPMCPYEMEMSFATYVPFEYDEEVPEYLHDYEGNTIKWVKRNSDGSTAEIKNARLMDRTYQIPEGKYFMLGDNRNYSADSRYWNIPWADQDDILAKAYFAFFPEFRMIEEE